MSKAGICKRCERPIYDGSRAMNRAQCNADADCDMRFELPNLKAEVERLTRERDALRAALEAVDDDLEVMATSAHSEAIEACEIHAQNVVTDALASVPAPVAKPEACPDCSVSGGAMAVAERVREECARYVDHAIRLDNADSGSAPTKFGNEVRRIDLSALVKGAAK